MKRALGVCNCQYRVGKGEAVCLLDGKRCKVVSDASGLWCRGWLPSGAPSALQRQLLLFRL
jgi:hypothetical protein